MNCLRRPCELCFANERLQAGRPDFGWTCTVQCFSVKKLLAGSSRLRVSRKRLGQTGTLAHLGPATRNAVLLSKPKRSSFNAGFWFPPPLGLPTPIYGCTHRALNIVCWKPMQFCFRNERFGQHLWRRSILGGSKRAARASDRCHAKCDGH